jgi:hypothetical protein
MVFDQGLATTFTLDPVTLLGVPLHLTWLASQQDSSILTNTIQLLESLQRVSKRLTVFADRGRMHVPAQANALFALLEDAIIEVRAPRGGCFHPKIWLLRFVDADGAVLLRLGVLSRNLTSDRSWDLSLVLEGTPKRSYVAANREFGMLIKGLPGWAVGEVDAERRAQVGQLADEFRRTTWDLPGRWEELSFHVLGNKAGPWDLGGAREADDLAVISPFLTPGALELLLKSARRPVALVSRPDTLAALPATVREKFKRCLILDEAAETDNGEEPEHRDTFGLHAKAVLMRRGWYTHLFVGSANATNAAMVDVSNVEVMVELKGRHSQVGHIEHLLDREVGFAGVLTDFDPQTEVDPEEAARAQVEAALEKVQLAVAKAKLTVRCTVDAAGDWKLTLSSEAPIALDGVAARAWPLSLMPDQGADAQALGVGELVVLGVVATADVTGLVGFELALDGMARRFALNLPVDGLPEGRDAAILRRVVHNREGFLRYLRLLLGMTATGYAVDDEYGSGGSATWNRSVGGAEGSLLEDLVRAWSREPARLRDVQRVVERLRVHTEEDGAVIPPDFEALWSVFELALGEVQ